MRLGLPSLTPRERVHAALLVLAALGLAAHQLAWRDWFVEDAAISFAFARNLASGEGLVAFPGGERVEGYSNPTWVAVLAVLQLLGFDPFNGSVKAVQLILGLGTLPPVYLAMREATGRESDAPVVAAIFLAVNTQLALWGAAGLENALLHFLMAMGIWRMMVEARTGSIPWSSLLWMLLALTRPEGILYAAVAGAWSMVLSLHRHRTLVPTAQWLGLFFGPWSVYQAVHYWYFAWPFPNTYYGKLGEREWSHWAWDGQAWRWTRRFFHEMGQGYFLPVWAFGVLGDAPKRVPLAVATFGGLGLLIQLTSDQRWLLAALLGAGWAAFVLALRAGDEEPPRGLVIGSAGAAVALFGAAEIARAAYGIAPNTLPVPALVQASPPFVIAALAVLLPLAGVGSRGWELRVLSFLLCATATFFAIYVQWDWMKGFRWYAAAAVPGSLLFAFGVDAVVQTLGAWFSRAEPAWRGYGAPAVALVVGALGLQAYANVSNTVEIVRKPETSPRGILQRVRHVEEVRARLHVDEPLVDLDVDQGAHLWWSDFVMMDMAGLIDVPFGHQHYAPAFLREYVFQEMRPHYAHVHGSWADNTQIPALPEWEEQYVGIPGYAEGPREHQGSFVRRDLIVSGQWPHGEGVALPGGVVVYPPHVPSEPASARTLYVEVGAASREARDFRWVMFAARDGRLVGAWDLPPGYDWLPPSKWAPDEVFTGRFDLQLPKMEPGTYDLGFVVTAPDGAVLGTPGEAPPILAAGEVLFPASLRVLSPADRDRASEQDRADALAQAQAGACDAAEQAWWRARKHRPLDTDWIDAAEPALASAFAACWAASADGEDVPDQVRRLVRAHRWDHWSPPYRERAAALADALHAEGLAARAAGDWEVAYRAFADAVAVDPTRAWSRRYAEEARAHRLALDPAAQKATEEVRPE